MNLRNEIEDVLKQLGNDWPKDDSFVNQVMNKIDDDSSTDDSVEVRSQRRISMKLLVAIAASLAVIFTAWWGIGTRSNLYAQVSQAVRGAKTIQAFRFVQKASGEPVAVSKTWYEKGIGFRFERDQTVRFGNNENMWVHRKSSGKAVRTSTGDIEKVLAPLFAEVDGIAKQLDREFSRSAKADREINGVLCQAYRLTDFKTIVDDNLRNGTARMTVFLDSNVRLVRSVYEVKQGDEWLKDYTDWKYDEAVEPSLFTPNFGDDVQVVDADEAFSHMFDPATALHSEERDGLIFAVHQISRFGSNGVYFVSSVRGTEKTLEEFPIKIRRVRPGEFVARGPAKNYYASPLIPGDGRTTPGCYRLKLASATHQGVDVCWWVMIPRGFPYTFETEPGKLRFRVGVTPSGDYAEARHMRADGLIRNISWAITLNVPQQEAIPTFANIAGQIYSDHENLALFPSKSLSIGSRAEHKSGSIDAMSSEEFIHAASNLVRSWQASNK